MTLTSAENTSTIRHPSCRLSLALPALVPQNSSLYFCVLTLPDRHNPFSRLSKREREAGGGGGGGGVQRERERDRERERGQRERERERERQRERERER